MAAMDYAVCLVSGGLDSCVALACARRDGLETAILHISYGQITAGRERRAFQAIADFYSIRKRRQSELPLLAEIGGSALTDPSIPLPPGDLNDDGIPVSYVPFRNGNLLGLAASWAETLQASFLYIGAVNEDSAGYPDCRPAFFEAMGRAIREGTRAGSDLTIRAPLIQMSKSEIVRLGIQLEAPLHLTWSCYRDQDRPCGDCDSCVRRRRGFEEAGVRDPALRASVESR